MVKAPIERRGGDEPACIRGASPHLQRDSAVSNFSARVVKTYARIRSGGDEAQGLAEYTLMLTLIALVCIAALTLLGGNIASFLNTLAGYLVP